MPTLPAAFRRPVLLIVGCGDVGLRVLRLLSPQLRAGRGWRVVVLTSSPERAQVLRATGAQPLVGNLDDPASLRRLAGLADAVLHLAPPPLRGDTDPRTRALAQALRRPGGQRSPGTLRPGRAAQAPRHWVYASTTGVYGDAGGAWLTETHRLAPATDRARRRVDAEATWRAAGRAPGVSACVLRIPGIYALDREGGDPRERVRRGAPVLQPEDDVYTNHIHADDLARACLAALTRGRPQRAYHVADATQRRMGAHFDAVADACGLPRPPRLSLAQAREQLTPVQLSFWSESRRLDTTRLHHELRVVLRYPDVLDALAEALPRQREPGDWGD